MGGAAVTGERAHSTNDGSTRDTEVISTAGLALDAAAVPAYLMERGLLASSEHVTVEELVGGVSCSVFAVESPDLSFVVKQALGQLRVAQTWLADQDRSTTEAEALRVYGALTPNAVPVYIDADPTQHVLTMSRAPRGWQNWKDQLMLGDVRPDVAADLGSVLGRWHSGTQDVPRLHPRFRDESGFEQLRISPYHRAVQEHHPVDRADIGRVIAGMRGRRLCLVHGDFSPKNVLVGPRDSWVLDFEVAHIGDPTFDVAFLLSHLVLKVVHLPEVAPELTQCALAFVEAYAATADCRLQGTPSWLARHLGCLLLARVDGKSPAGYLTPDEQAIVRQLGRALLRGQLVSVSDVFHAATRGLA